MEIDGRIPAVIVGVVGCLPSVVSPRAIVSSLIEVYPVGEDREAGGSRVAALRWLVGHGLTVGAEASTRQLMAQRAPGVLVWRGRRRVRG